MSREGAQPTPARSALHPSTTSTPVARRHHTRNTAHVTRRVFMRNSNTAAQRHSDRDRETEEGNGVP